MNIEGPSRALPAAIAARVEIEGRALAERIWRDYAREELRRFVAIDPEGLGTAVVAMHFITLAMQHEKHTRRCVRQPLVRINAVRDAARERMRCDEAQSDRAA